MYGLVCYSNIIKMCISINLTFNYGLDAYVAGCFEI